MKNKPSRQTGKHRAVATANEFNEGAKRPADPVGWRRAGNEQMMVLPKVKKSSGNDAAHQSEGRAFNNKPSCEAVFHTQYERREARLLDRLFYPFGILLFMILSFPVFSCIPYFQTSLFSNRYLVLMDPNRYLAPVESNDRFFSDLIDRNYSGYTAPKIPYDFETDGLFHVSKQKHTQSEIESKHLSQSDFNLLQDAKNQENINDAIKLLNQMQNQTAVSYYKVALRYPLNYKEHTKQRFSDIPYPTLTAKNTPWQLWALFNVARGNLFKGTPDSIKQSIIDFNKVIDLVEKGVEDTQHVAAGSLGYLATAYLENKEYDKSFETIFKLKALGAKDYSRRFSDNLSYIEYLPEDERRSALNEPLTRSLMIIRSYTDYTRYNEQQDKTLNDLVNLSEQHIEGIEYLANSTYDKGQYEIAKKLALKSNKLLAKSILAKLALREGQLEKSLNYYSQISSELKKVKYNDDLSIDSCSMLGQNAIVMAYQGDFTTAFESLMKANGEYWADAAYLAEEVLPLDYLINFINTHSQIDTNVPINNYGLSIRGEKKFGIQSNPYLALKNLLARRLMREGEIKKAITLFEGRKKELAQKFYELQSKTETTNGETRAKYLWQLAKLMRIEGSELLAYEAAPDWYMYDLNWTGLGKFSPPEAIKVNLVHNKEQIIAANKQNIHRWSYRGVAAETASSAADLLDPQSQDYENLLCKAASWVFKQSQSAAWHYFVKFQKNAKPTEDRKYFGRNCKTPFSDGGAK